jgi:hypothetical protein
MYPEPVSSITTRYFFMMRAVPQNLERRLPKANERYAFFSKRSHWKERAATANSLRSRTTTSTKRTNVEFSPYNSPRRGSRQLARYRLRQERGGAEMGVEPGTL